MAWFDDYRRRPRYRPVMSKAAKKLRKDIIANMQKVPRRRPLTRLLNPGGGRRVRREILQAPIRVTEQSIKMSGPRSRAGQLFESGAVRQVRNEEGRRRLAGRFRAAGVVPRLRVGQRFVQPPRDARRLSNRRMVETLDALLWVPLDTWGYQR